MEELLTKLLSTLQVPTIVVGISAIVFKLLTFLPVTFVTAQDFEKKFYTKEQRLLHQIVHFIFSMIVVTIFMVLIGDYFANNTHWYNPWIALVALIYVIFFFYLIFGMAAMRKKITGLDSLRNRRFFMLATGIYCAAATAIVPYSTGSIIGGMYQTKPETMSLEYFLVLAIIYFICSALIVVLLKPLNSVLAFNTEKVVSIEMDKEGQKEKWYLLHPVKSDSYLIGDNYIPVLCKRNRIITKEELVQKEFLIEDLDDMKNESSIAKNNKIEDEKTVTS
ncbi:hypothetical protein AB432_018620 [Brevibacillus brevis]|uniref:Uncharacterized protein n=1 Tax=Brevibacillus brevis TaxID=1393 RepID=A0A2Z4MK69_BREBE|nr:hypothetical protein [Brevibacillus brevis]AWX56937.1 hypothetical protein AB432_018620 [Brevibacillus brevis]